MAFFSINDKENQLKEGDHLWYETCFGNGKCILVFGKFGKANAIPLKQYIKNDYMSTHGQTMIQCVDISEVKQIDIEEYPEYYVREGVRV